MNLLYSLYAFIIITGSLGDVYMHNPRGSNDRCDERTNNRNNANRLFDSQNNAAGGYAVPCQDTDLKCFNARFYSGSLLDIRYTTQHACGIQNQCEIVIQYGCNMRNGRPENSVGNTCTQTIPDNLNELNNTRFGYHERYDSYQWCKQRTRNINLYTGDQSLKGESSIYTRQNPNGNRYGFECPEERDYYPYWNYSVWSDIAVLTSNISRCSYYKNNSNNKYIVCDGINNTMANRLGATYGGDKESSFMWKIPIVKMNDCVLRIRYNISLPSDLMWDADLSSNDLFKTNPLIYVDNRFVRLALDTSQLPRTFEDRSYTFDIITPPSDILGRIFNVNVMGKRGNIAQIRNCIEYDFVPNNLTIYDDDYLHFQWVGSDYNPLNNDGEGRNGTDRSNIVVITDYFGFKNSQNNTFIPRDLIDAFVFLFQDNSYCYNITDLIQNNKIKNTQDIRNCALLNNASVYFNVRIFNISIGNASRRTYLYMSTRNNNFSNRNQKGVINVLNSTMRMVSSSLSYDGSDTRYHSNQISIGVAAMILIGSLLLFGSAIYYRKNKTGFNSVFKNLKRSLLTKV
jgi:hypothetical protein